MCIHIFNNTIFLFLFNAEQILIFKNIFLILKIIIAIIIFKLIVKLKIKLRREQNKKSILIDEKCINTQYP